MTDAVTVTVSPFCFDSSKTDRSLFVWGGGVVPDSDVVSSLDVTVDCVPSDGVLLEVVPSVEPFDAVPDSVGVEALGVDEVLSAVVPSLVTDEVF